MAISTSPGTARSVLITGGAGFIGSHTVRRMIKSHPGYFIVNADKLTYAGNLMNLEDIERYDNYRFEKVDIADKEAVNELFNRYKFDMVIHLAAESHVDRSISSPDEFVHTNVNGTVNLLNAARKIWDGSGDNMFYHISTDEVYGSLGKEGLFTEDTPYDPKSPYSASKAASDHFVRAYHNTFGLPAVISNCSNNYGPNQFPEKLIPLAIINIKAGKKVPVYGKGENIRDWLFVEDHVRAIDLILHKGKAGATYNIGGNNEWKNIDLVYLLCELMDEKLGRKKGESASLISFVKDRAGHDMRYAIDSSKIMNELGWTPLHNFREGLSKTVDWYLQNTEWVDNVLSGDYEKYYEDQYLNR